MKKNERIVEMVNSMSSFSKNKYQREELVPELFRLQREIVEITFNGSHASTADLKLWDVEKHLEQLNNDCGNIADEELHTFVKESRRLSNLIRAEVSGSKGEAKAFRSFTDIKSENIILKNVELSDGDVRTELDAVVITPTRISIVEVKNTARDIFIDKNGDYFRTGEFLRWDSNIAEKIQLKERLLRSALKDCEMHNIPIRSIVVFTNNRIEVQNKYNKLRTCFVSQLAQIIDESDTPECLTREKMKLIECMIQNAESKEEYACKFDVNHFKLVFARVMAKLEEASAEDEERVFEKEVNTEEHKKRIGSWGELLKSSVAGMAGSTAAAVAVFVASTVAVNVLRNGGVVR